jgi:nitroimidazol reductase NimA-like FMN-containing flavoprotein (pyridoxamine 5'-phosphate oxidase superfamily)
MNLKTKMRRSEKAIIDLHYIESILKKAPVGILSMCNGKTPYSIPVNFYYEDNTIYIHCAKKGQKIEYITGNPHVCFLVVNPVEITESECGGAMNYESILCNGKASFFDTSSREVLLKLGKKYSTCSDVTDEECQETALIKIEIEEVSAKKAY